MKSIPELLSSSNTLLLDVRSPMEFASEKLDGSLNIPVDEIHLHLDEIKQKNQDILVYCRSGARSAMAKSIMEQAGIRNVVNGGSIFDLLFEIQIRK